MTKETWEVIKKEFVQREEEDKYQDYVCLQSIRNSEIE